MTCDTANGWRCAGVIIATIGLLVVAGLSSPAVAAGDEAAGNESPARPAIRFHRWQEDWSVLADPRLRTGPLDWLKYIPLSSTDPNSYLSFGQTMRERFEFNNAPFFGTGNNQGDSYLLDRIQWHADLRPNAHWQLFAELEDVRAFWKKVITPVDENPGDLRMAFVTYVGPLADGVFKIRVGRQQMAFDLERFVSIRDGPNVQQAYDAIWLDWERDAWRTITFWSQPVQYRHEHPFDDYSSQNFQYGGFRIERKNVGPGELSSYYSRFMMNNATYLDASGDERRNNFDVRYAGASSGFDWDLEFMGQTGHVGSKRIRAWAFGSRSGYTLDGIRWTPRLGLQLDAASGDQHPNDGTLGTFNPLFPNGYYFTLAGYTGYVNLIHVKPSLTLRPISTLTLMGAIAMQWRQTTGDAVYVQPNNPVKGTAGMPGLWTGAYFQVRADWAITPNVTASMEAVNFQVGDAIRRAGGRNSNYVNVQILWAW